MNSSFGMLCRDCCSDVCSSDCPMGMFYGLIFDGFYDNEEELANSPKHTTSQVGTIKFKDLNDDGIISQEDRPTIGSPWPDFTFGMTNNVNYKNFDLSVTISGSYGNLIEIGRAHV